MKRTYFGFCSLAVSGMVLALSLPAQAQTVASYVCDDDQTFEVTYDGDEAELVLEDEDPITLTSVVTASGTRYSDGTTSLFTQGQEAFIEVDGDRTYENCVTDAEFAADVEDESAMDESMAEEEVVIEDESVVEESSTEEEVIVESSTTVETVETVETTQQPTTRPAPAPAPAPAARPAPAPQPVRGLW